MARVNVKDAPSPILLAAEALIVKGKEQGFLSPDDILAGFPDVKLDPDQLFRIVDMFRDMGIEVSDGEIAAPVRKPIRVVGIAHLTADQWVALAKAIKTGDHDTRQKIVAAATVEEVDEILDLTDGPGKLGK